LASLERIGWRDRHEIPSLPNLGPKLRYGTLDPIENAGHPQNVPNRLRKTLSAGFQRCNIVLHHAQADFPSTVGPSGNHIESKQIEFFDLTGGVSKSRIPAIVSTPQKPPHSV
jgi:hypothetical protein